MLTTLAIVLRRAIAMSPEAAWAVSEQLAAVAEFGPLGEPPHMILGGTGLFAMNDAEDIGVAETAPVGKADLLIAHDLGDFEHGHRARLRTERVGTGSNGRPAALLIHHALLGTVRAAVPEVAIGWLLGSMEVSAGLRAALRRDLAP
jgi:hypothetical protein